MDQLSRTKTYAYLIIQAPNVLRESECVLSRFSTISMESPNIMVAIYSNGFACLSVRVCVGIRVLVEGVIIRARGRFKIVTSSWSRVFLVRFVVSVCVLRFRLSKGGLQLINKNFLAELWRSINCVNGSSTGQILFLLVNDEFPIQVSFFPAIIVH